MEEEKTIALAFRRQDFEDVYYKNKQGNIFLGPSVKVAFIIFLIVVFIFFFSLYYSIKNDKYVIFTGASFFCLLFVCYNYLTRAQHVWKWKRSINSYLNELSKFKSHKITLTSTSFCINQDSEETIEKWSEINKAVMKEDYITLYGSSTYFFPKKSMTEDNYNYFVDIVNRKIKNGL